MELWVGTWWGNHLSRPNRWLRFFDEKGNLVLAEWEAEAEAHQAAEAARSAAEAARSAAEAEVARLKAKLKELGQDED